MVKSSPNRVAVACERLAVVCDRFAVASTADGGEIVVTVVEVSELFA